MLPIKKLYIDSRFKSSDSVSDSNFKIDLPQNLLMPEGTGFYIDDISIPVSWYVIDTGRNVLYYKVNGQYAYAEIQPGNYSLVTLNQAIVDQMNLGFPNHFTSAPDVKTNKVGINGITTATFEILTDDQAKANGFTGANSINNVLRNLTPQVANSFSNWPINLP